MVPDDPRAVDPNRTYDIVTLPGDGIGPEVLAHGVRILQLAGERLGIRFQLEEIPCGGRYYLEHGSRDWPEGAEGKCAQADVILLGAVGWPSPTGGGAVTMADGRMAGYSAVIGNRVQLDLFANVRPVKLYPGVRQRLHGVARRVWDPELVDFVIVRENTEDLYIDAGGILSPGGRSSVATDIRLITRTGAERVIRFSYDLARRRGRGSPKDGRKRLTCIVKDNVLYGCKLFAEICREIAPEYTDVETEFALVDSCAMRLMTEPEHFDVCVTTNLFGDILTDLASVLQGGMGMAVGANIGAAHGMFEPVHGSSPPLAGKDEANPLATILAVGEALRWLGERETDGRLITAADAVERAVRQVLSRGETLTFDLADEGRAAPTSVVAQAVYDELDRTLSAPL